MINYILMKIGTLNKRMIIRGVILSLFVILFSIQASALDYPHSGANIITCDACHSIYGGEPSLLPPWTSLPQWP
jgi:hypothetical protein